MPDVVASGIISGPADALAGLLSRTSSFQSLMSVGSAAAALALIDIVAWGLPTQAKDRPNALVAVPRNAVWGRGAYGNGRLWLSIEVDTPAEYLASHRNAGLYFCNLFGGVVEELMVDQEAPGELIITRITMDSPPARCVKKAAKQKTPDALQDYFEAAVWVDYGLPPI